MKLIYIPIITMLILSTQSSCLNNKKVIYFGSQPNYELVEDPSKQIECKYFSVFPPEGNDWYYLDKNNSIVFLKKYNSYHTLVIAVGPINIPDKFKTPDEYIYFIKTNKFKNINPERFKNLENIIQKNNRFGKYCVKFHIKSEDHKIPIWTPQGYLIIQDDGYIFQRNPMNNLNINIVCSERYDINENDPQAAKIFSRFIDKLILK